MEQFDEPTLCHDEVEGGSGWHQFREGIITFDGTSEVEGLAKMDPGEGASAPNSEPVTGASA